LFALSVVLFTLTNSTTVCHQVPQLEARLHRLFLWRNV